MSQRITQRIIQDGIIPQPTLSPALQRRLSAPVADHSFDVVSDLPRAQEPEKAPKGADDAQRT